MIGPAVDDAPELTPLILSSTSYTAYLKEKDEYFKAREINLELDCTELERRREALAGHPA